jgi:hypothetical protein
MPFFLPKWAGVAVSLLLAFLLGGVGTVAASGGAVPGGLLYPVKQMREETQLWFSLSPEAKVYLYSNLVNERVEELTMLATAEDTHSGSISVDRLEQHVNSLNQLIVNHESQLADAITTVEASLSEAESAALQVIDETQGEAHADLQQALSILETSRLRVQSALNKLSR